MVRSKARTGDGALEGVDLLTDDLELVGRLAVLGQVEAENLFLLWHSQADDGVHDLQDDEGHHTAEDPGDDDGQDLREELGRVAVEEPIRAGGVDGRRGEDASREGAPCATYAVDGPD